jgi:ferritin-like metal-binding protein YciE
MSLLTPNRVNALSVHALFVHELHDLYDAEHQIIDALPKMIEQATNPALKKALSDHLKQTQQHVTRLEDCFNAIQEQPKRMTCDGMKGLIKEGEHVLKGKMDPALKDDAIIGAAQRVEHYEIAGYGTAREHAKNMHLDDVVELLDKTLKEEGEADHLLTGIARAAHRELAKAAK